MATMGQIMKALEIKGNRESLQVLQKEQDENNLKKSTTQQKIKEKETVWRTKRNWMGLEKERGSKSLGILFLVDIFREQEASTGMGLSCADPENRVV